MTTTYVDGVDSTLLVVSLGTGSSPYTYAQPILINTSRSFSQKANTTAAVLPCVSNPLLPGETIRTTTSTDSTISGDGVCSTSVAETWAAMVGNPVPIQVTLGTATGDLLVQGMYILEEFTVTGQKLGELVTSQLKLSQAAAPTISAHT